MPAGWLFRAVA